MGGKKFTCGYDLNLIPSSLAIELVKHSCHKHIVGFHGNALISSWDLERGKYEDCFALVGFGFDSDGSRRLISANHKQTELAIITNNFYQRLSTEHDKILLTKEYRVNFETTSMCYSLDDQFLITIRPASDTPYIILHLANPDKLPIIAIYHLLTVEQTKPVQFIYGIWHPEK